MTDRYPIPAGMGRSEMFEKNSRFIGVAGLAASEATAEDFIQSASAEFPDAHHHVWAYLLGFGPTARYACHNDGEPGGTAGPPALAALHASGLGDVAVVVTRYFGGIKLGTGGLARAYGGVARAAVAALPRGERVLRCRLSVTLAYHFHDAFQRILAPHEATILAAEYADVVRFSVEIPVDRRAAFAAVIKELTAGQASVT